MQKDLKYQLKNKEGDSRDWHPRGPTREDNRDRRRPRGPPAEDNPNRKSWHGSSPYDRGENRKSWHAGSQRGDTERETREVLLYILIDTRCNSCVSFRNHKFNNLLICCYSNQCKENYLPAEEKGWLICLRRN